MKAVIVIIFFVGFSASALAKPESKHGKTGSPSIAEAGQESIFGGADGSTRVPFQSEKAASVDARFQNNMN
ncbi:hypothetical protein [Pseudomonas sp. Snoq117.2]|uniref:hypothetical protein n=1 Tax=Pseudomonas sp. Snoq117.2 TaxID=1500302 RepID=UPI00116084F3|nr:hypothetical protein [Pseudomonas sp. Snoq117.2]